MKKIIIVVASIIFITSLFASSSIHPISAQTLPTEETLQGGDPPVEIPDMENMGVDIQPSEEEKPSNWRIFTPWRTTVDISNGCSYNDSRGACNHTNTVNQFYAFDFNFIPEGGEIYPIAPGDVIFADTWSGFGKVVVIRHDYVDLTNNYYSLYGHLNEIKVTSGETRIFDKVLGIEGNSGCPGCGIHLHFSLWRCPKSYDIFAGGSKPSRLVSTNTQCASVRPEPMVGEHIYESFTTWEKLANQGGYNTEDRKAYGYRPTNYYADVNPPTGWWNEGSSNGEIPAGQNIKFNIGYEDVGSHIKEVRLTVYYPGWAAIQYQNLNNYPDLYQKWPIVARCDPQTGACGSNSWHIEWNPRNVTKLPIRDNNLLMVPWIPTPLAINTSGPVDACISFDIFDNYGNSVYAPGGVRCELPLHMLENGYNINDSEVVQLAETNQVRLIRILPDTKPSTSDNANFVTDLSFPDGSILPPGQSITKTWRMKNTGSTSWGSGYQLVFLRGDRMGAPASINVPSTAPGQNVDLSVSITAPSSPGSYMGYWRLRNPQGTYFGPEIWVSLEVANQGSHITAFSADPLPPSDTTSVRIRARVENFPNFRALRMKVGNQVICEETTLEATCTWNTVGYSAGSHNVMVEVADQTDTSWSRSEKRSMVYTLTGTGASNNHVPNRPGLVSPYDWYVYYSGNTANLCAQSNGDPDGDAITGYYFEVSGAETWNSGWVGSSCVNTAGMGPHTYGWRVKVRDNRGGESDWSDSWHYTLVNSSLSITQLDFQPLDANSEQVRIRACTAGQGGIGITMKVMVNEANDGSGNGKWNTIYELGVPCFNDIDAPTWNTLKYSDGTHRIRVEAHGLNTGWDGAAVLEKTYALPHRRPAGPELYSPVPASRNGGEAVYLNGQSIRFNWENTLRNNGYTLHVGLTSNPQTEATPVLRQSLGANVTEFTATFNQEYPTLYWQVVANGDAGSSGSNSQKFGIDRTPPSCTIQPLSPVIYDNAFKVTWQGTDAVAGIANFDIQYLDTGRGEWLDWQTNQPASKTFDMFTGQPGHEYSFRCRSTDTAGNQSPYPSDPSTTTKIDPTSRPSEPWWSTGYSYKRNLIILNNDTDWMPPHFPVRVHFDGTTTPTAAEIYNASKTAVKGNDIRIVYQNQTELNRVIQRFSNTQIDIWIPLQVGLGSGVSDSTNYQIYYGNVNAGGPPANVSAVFMPEADANTVGLWHFQEGGGAIIYDSSGRNHNGTYSNVGWLDGPTGWAGSFNGVNSSVEIPHSNDFNSNQMTIEAWVYVSVFNGIWHPLVNKRVPYNPGGFEFRFSNDRQILLINDITTGNWDVRSDTLEAGRWYHVAGTFNGSNRSCIYVNGNLVRCRDLTSGTPKFNSGPVTIGFSYEGSGNKSMPGYIQHVRLSNIARTDFQYARIDVQPSVAAGIQQVPPVIGQADLAVVSLTTYPNPSGGILVEAIVKNQGTVSTTNGFYTDLYIDHLPTGAGDYTGSLQFWVNDPIAAGDTATLTTVITDLSQIGLAATTPGEEKRGTLYVQTDSTGALTETDKANNITSGTEVCVVSPDAFEGDETYTTAHQIDASHQHNFDRPNDEDWVKLIAMQGQTYKIQTSNLGPNSDTYMYLYGPDGVTLLASNDDFNGTLASHIKWTAPADGTYYIQVKQWNPSLGGCGTSYTLTLFDNNVFLPIVSR